jgi:hypothetical protein
MAFMCHRLHHPPNQNLEQFPVLGTGTGKWRGIVLTGNLREAQRFRIPTVTSLGESVDWMDIWRMT